MVFNADLKKVKHIIQANIHSETLAQFECNADEEHINKVTFTIIVSNIHVEE